MEPQIVVGLDYGDGQILFPQPYSEFQYENKSRKILIPARGRSLISILQDDLGKISYEENRWKLKQVLSNRPMVDTMTLLGRIAEAVLVRRCNESPELNFRLFQLASKKRARISTANRFMAIGTGLRKTQTYYSKHYNPTDPQRDIVWVDKECNLALMRNSTSQAGIIAGLQVKTSTDGIRYILRDIIDNRYEVPIVYFSLHNDYEQIVVRLMEEISRVNSIEEEYWQFRPQEDFVDIRVFDHDAYDEVMDYYPIVSDLISGDLELDELVDIAFKRPSLQNIVLGTALQESNAEIIIER